MGPPNPAQPRLLTLLTTLSLYLILFCHAIPHLLPRDKDVSISDLLHPLAKIGAVTGPLIKTPDLDLEFDPAELNQRRDAPPAGDDQHEAAVQREKEGIEGDDVPPQPKLDQDQRNGNAMTMSVELVRNPKFDGRRNGPAAYARALAKWGLEVPRELREVLGQVKGAVGEINAESVRDDREYLSRVGFGTPPQWLDVDMDTGSSDVWIYTSDTKKNVAGDRKVFDIDKSKTARKVNNTSWMITYGDGSRAWGNVYTDHISLGNLTIQNATIESAISASASLTDDPDIDGIFGLAYALPSQTIPRQPTVLSAIVPQLAEPIFTVDLRWHSDKGAYTFGFVDKGRIKKGKQVYWTPVVGDSGFWQVDYADARVVDGKNGGKKNNDYIEENKEKKRMNGKLGSGNGWTAIVDTGTTLLLLDQETCATYYSKVPNATYNRSLGGLWTYPCQLSDTDTGAKGGKMAPYEHPKGSNPNKRGGAGTLPDFEIEFDNGFVATIPGVYMNYSSLPDDEETCMGGLQSFDMEDFGILGDVFLKAVYAVFDVEKGQVGFAEKELELEEKSL